VQAHNLQPLPRATGGGEEKNEEPPNSPFSDTQPGNSSGDGSEGIQGKGTRFRDKKRRGEDEEKLSMGGGGSST